MIPPSPRRRMTRCKAQPARSAIRRSPVDAAEIEDRVAADQSSAFPVFMFIAFACMWLLVGSTAGLVSSIKLHEPDWMNPSAGFARPAVQRGSDRSEVRDAIAGEICSLREVLA
jgi:hypothetical protein